MNERPIEPINESRHYAAHELFFSITDEKGKIRYGNEVFTRISGYEESELLDKPHNIVRHPDMPRCVFQLLWDYLESGRSIAAYVKNLAEDGRYYWVLATATPCEGGYLSVRLKPSTVLFDAAQNLYTETLALERRVERESGRREAIRQSTEFLLGKLREAGFDDYDAFMRAALAQEMTACAAALDASAHTDQGATDELCERMPRVVEDLTQVFHSLDLFQNLSDRLTQKSEVLEELGPSLAFLAMNANISASRLGDEGAVLSVVSRTLGERSKEADALIGTLVDRIGPLCSQARGVAFEVAVALLESRVVESFAREVSRNQSASESTLVQMSLSALAEELVSRVGRMMASLRELVGDLGAISAAASGLVNQIDHMKVAQVNGKIEIASCRRAAGFGDIFNDVATIVDAARIDCEDILEVLTVTDERVGDLLELQPQLVRELRAVGDTINRMTRADSYEPVAALV